MSIFSDYENGYMDDDEYREECKRMNNQDRYERDHEFDEPDEEEETDEENTEKMTNEEMLDKVLRHFFPRALFIREINKESHTKKIIFTDVWLKKPYKGGE